MKILPWSRTVLLGCALVVISNAAILGGAAWTRQGRENTGLILSERELALPPVRESENTAIALSIMTTGRPPRAVQQAAWAKRYELQPLEYPWLDRARLAELGFRTDLDPSDPSAGEFYEGIPRRRVWAAFELDGPAFRQWLAGRESAVAKLRQEVLDGSGSPRELADSEALLELDRVMRSRLFPIDASLDGEALRRKYADPARQIVLPAVVELKRGGPNEKPPALKGILSIPEVPDVTVPHEWYSSLEKILPPPPEQEVDRDLPRADVQWPSAVPPRYEAVVRFGRRYEPWIERISSLSPGN